MQLTILQRGIAWNMLSTAVAQCCGFLRLFFVAAAIGPEQMGLFAILIVRDTHPGRS